MVNARERKRLNALDARKREKTIQMFKDRFETSQKVCLCACERELGEHEIEEIATETGCAVSFVGQVISQERWDYKLRGKVLNLEDKELLAKHGLRIYLGG